MKKIMKIYQIKSFLQDPVNIVGDQLDLIILHASTIENAKENSVIWISSKKKNKLEIIQSSKASLIICDFIEEDLSDLVKDKVVFQVKNPKLIFIKILNLIYEGINKKKGIDKNAKISKDALIGQEVYIGSGTHIGKCKIGSGTIIHGNCFIHDDVEIGENVIINPGTVIGGNGFGFEKDEHGNIFHFPHIGRVKIGNNVSIGSNCSIDKGTLGDTIISNEVKIDNLVHIAHNVIIGERTYIIAKSMIAGSVKIGKDCWISPSSAIRNGITIGDNSLIGLGAVVTKNIPENEIWFGVPAKKLKRKSL